MPTPLPTEKDRENAALVLDYIKRLRELGEFASEDTRQGEIFFIACMLRNERLEHRLIRRLAREKRE